MKEKEIKKECIVTLICNFLDGKPNVCTKIPKSRRRQIACEHHMSVFPEHNWLKDCVLERDKVKCINEPWHVISNNVVFWQV